MKATDTYRKLNNSPIKGIVLYYTKEILKNLTETKLGSVIETIQTGKTPPKSNPKYYESQDINWFKSSDIGFGKYLVDAKEKFSKIAVVEKKATIYPKNTLLIIGIGGGVGRVAVLKEEGSSNQQITGITFNQEVSPEYAYYYYLVREDYVKSQAKSMSFPILNQDKIKGLKFAFPPIEEQIEFIQFIEACWNAYLLHKLPNLDEFKVNDELKVYALKQFKAINLHNLINQNIQNEIILLSELRQSILKDAFEGTLTLKWRNDNENIKTVSELFDKIKKDKESLIQEKIIKKDIIYNYTIDFPYSIPKSWKWCFLGDVCTKVTDGFHHTPQKMKEGKIYVSPKHLKNNKMDWKSCDYISNNDHSYLSKKTTPKKGEILIANRGTIGVPAIIDIDEEFSFQNLALIGFNQSLIISKYIFYYIQFKKQDILDFFANGGLQPMLSNKILKTLPLPLVPTEEQIMIIQKIESLFNSCESLEKEILESIKQANQLMQAVLKEAFEVKEEVIIN